MSIVPFLRARGIRHIDWLVISHADLDHSGGLESIRRDIGAGSVLLGEPLADVEGDRCLAGRRWESAGVSFDILHPVQGTSATGNDSSCVLRVSVGDHGLLLTGDIEAESERTLLQDETLIASDIVVVPHHGSLTSSTVRFTDAVHPDYAVVSAGFKNRWDLPKPRIVERWQAAGAEVLNTATHGAIHFRVCRQGGVVGVTRERQRRHRFWHARH